MLCVTKLKLHLLHIAIAVHKVSVGNMVQDMYPARIQAVSSFINMYLDIIFDRIRYLAYPVHV